MGGHKPSRRRAARTARRSQAGAIALLALLATIAALCGPATPRADAAAGPATVAQHAIVVLQNHTATFAYRINDQTSVAAEVAIVVRALKNGVAGAVVRSYDAGHTRQTNTDLSLRFVADLAPGTYRWYVYATDAAGLAQTSIGSNTLTVRRPPFPSAAAIARAIAYLRARNPFSALAVVDSNGVLHGSNLDRRFTSASVVKAMLLVQYLRTHATITASMRATLTLMITRSNNAAAFRTFSIVHASGLKSLARLTGMKHFTAGGNVLYSLITAADQARFFYFMDKYIPTAHRAFARYLLSHIVPAQSWGIPRTARPVWHVYFKGGWFGGAADPFVLVNQIARLERGGMKWSLAVLTNHNRHSPYAFVTLQGVTARLLGR